MVTWVQSCGVQLDGHQLGAVTGHMTSQAKVLLKARLGGWAMIDYWRLMEQSH